MDPTQCSMWVTAAPPRQGPFVRGMTIAVHMYVHRLGCGLRLAMLDAGDPRSPPQKRDSCGGHKLPFFFFFYNTRSESHVNVHIRRGPAHHTTYNLIP